MSSESDFRDYSQTLSEPEEDKMEKEEDDNAQVIFSQMELYQDFTSSGEGNEVDEEAD